MATNYDKLLDLLERYEQPTGVIAKSVGHAMIMHEKYGSEVVIYRDGQEVQRIPERKEND